MRVIVLLLSFLLMPCAWAGPVIIDGTDSNDHGSTSGGANLDGWLYMQKVLENLVQEVSPSVTKVVVSLCTDDSGVGRAQTSITSAFNLSTLPGAGWTLTHLSGATAIASWLDALSTSNTGILAISSVGGLASGDCSALERTEINARATQISAYVDGAGNAAQGGALFALGEIGTGAYGWLSTLIPEVGTVTLGGAGEDSDMALTADGNAAFPGLTDADLSTGPWHAYFHTDVISTCSDPTILIGGLHILACAPEQEFTRITIIGGGTATCFEGNCVSEDDEGWGWSHRP